MVKMNDMLLSFMFLLVGVILLGVVADETTGATQANTVTNETISLTNGSTTSLANSQLDSFTSLVNSSNASQTYTRDTDYTVDLAAGSVTSLGPSGNANATYVFREVGNSTARSLTNLVIIFFAIGVFLASVGFAVRAFREMGLLK